MKRKMKQRLLLVLAALGLAVAAPVVVAPVAEARTLAQAQNDAYYFSAVDCPHHTAGRCHAREGHVLYGLGGGRWRIQTVGWECNALEGWWCNSRARARWYYTRECNLENNGTRSWCGRFTNDG